MRTGIPFKCVSVSSPHSCTRVLLSIQLCQLLSPILAPKQRICTTKWLNLKTSQNHVQQLRQTGGPALELQMLLKLLHSVTAAWCSPGEGFISGTFQVHLSAYLTLRRNHTTDSGVCDLQVIKHHRRRRTPALKNRSYILSKL